MFSKKKSPDQRRHTRVPQSPVRSNTVFSYHANRSVRESGHYRDAAREPVDAPKRRIGISWAKRLPNIALVASVCVVAVFLMQLSHNVAVRSVGTSNSQLFLRDKSVYVTAASEAFRSLANSNKLTVNTGKISAEIKRQFPELQAVSVALPVIGNRPTVYIQPAIPKMILVGKSGMYVLDGNGRALISGNQVSKLDELGVPVVNDESAVGIKAGDIALPKSTVRFIGEVVGQLKEKQMTMSTLTLPAGTSELHVTIDKAGYKVKFNLYGNPREEAGTFLATKQYLDEQKKKPREYIDVRVENKAYYQ